MVKIIIFRVLGNDLSGIHGDRQTYENLQFTLENEPDFPNTTKVFILNKIYDLKKKNEIINLLKKFDMKYIDIPFKIDNFRKIKYDNELDNVSTNDRKKNINLLYDYNLYLINNNGIRNYCINYGKKKGYDWVFPLDSNSFFTDYHFNEIYNTIINNKKIDYIVIPQMRLAHSNLQNKDLFKSKKIIDNSYTHEPQIAFKNTSKLKFNDKIPYGTSPKAELLRVLNVPGRWNNWNDNDKYLNIKDRPRQNINYILISKVIRLNPFKKKKGKNFDNRIVGLYNLVEQIRNENKINVIEGFNCKNSNKKNKILLLLIIILLLLFYIKFF